MKNILIIASLLCSACFASAQYSQQPGEPRLMKLTMSTPQPRLGETFQLIMDTDDLKQEFIKVLPRNLNIIDREDEFVNRGIHFTVDVKADKKGKFEAGPLTFEVNNTRYITNKLSYEVIDALPKTNSGLWIRNVVTSDSTFSIIIEQHAPALEVADYDKMVRFKDYDIVGVSTAFQPNSSFGLGSVNIKGKEKKYNYSYSVHQFEKTDKYAKVKITKDMFDNLPAGYKFTDIVIQ